MAFKARLLKKGFFEVQGIEEFIKGFIEKKARELDKKVDELKKALSNRRDARAAEKAELKVPPPKSAPASKALAAKPTKKKAPKGGTDTVLEDLQAALDAHSKRADLIKAGRQKDQLLRSLIPLYVGQKLDGEISSGVVSRFWATHGVKFAAPNAAKALREHVGYARRTKTGQQITPNGVKYVEAALSAKKSAA